MYYQDKRSHTNIVSLKLTTCQQIYVIGAYMPKFGKKSQERLATCHPDIVKIMEKVIEIYDFTVLEGVRSPERQKELVAQGKSKTLNSKHLPGPDGLSRAIDIAPYPVSWEESTDNLGRFYFLAGIVFAIAEELGIKIRWGLDWDMDKDFTDNTLNDYPHFELV